MIELMVALAVLAVIISVGLPQMSVFFKGGRMVTIPNELLAGLHIARSEAIKRNSRVTICKSTNADAVPPSCATGAVDWDQGWFVFVEGSDAANIVGAYSSNDGAILKVNTGVENNKATIKADSTQIENYVTFTSRGVPKQANGATQSGLFRVCDDRGLSSARGVVLNASGRVRVTQDADKIGACP